MPMTSGGGPSKTRLDRMHDEPSGKMESPQPPRVMTDFWTSVYQAIDD